MGIFHWLDTPVPDSHLMLLAAKILVEIRLPSDPEKQALTEPNGPGTSRHLVAVVRHEGNGGEGGPKKEKAPNSSQTPPPIVLRGSPPFPRAPPLRHVSLPTHKQ